MFVRAQNIAKNSDGVITRGSASIFKSVYDPHAKSGHSQQKCVEKLGKVVWLGDDKCTVGIYFSQTRGLIEYNLLNDTFTPVSPTDPRLEGTPYISTTPVHTTFGDAYLLMSILDQQPLMPVLRDVFGNVKLSGRGHNSLFQRVLAHTTHGILKNKASLKCGPFLNKSVLSHVLTDISRSTLDSDTSYFLAMGSDAVKLAFYKTFVEYMRTHGHPNFGRCCYVDSTPLPTEGKENPFVYLCDHGTDGPLLQARLALVLDIETGLPCWHHIFQSNILDHSTFMEIKEDVEKSIDVTIDTAILDAGYARKELFEAYNITNATYSEENGIDRSRMVIVRMPDRNGYPFDELYVENKGALRDAAYKFDYERHSYCGVRVERDVFGYPEYCYVFVDHTQADLLGQKFRSEHPEVWEAMSNDQKNWSDVKDGFLILICSQKMQPKDALIEYRSRTHIEGFFKDAKCYLNLLPLAKWSKETVLGKILSDIIEVIAYRMFRNAIAPTGLAVSDLLVELQGLSCVKDDSDIMLISTPNLQIREHLNKLGYEVPGHFDIAAFRKEILEGIPMSRDPVSTAKAKAGRKVKIKPCPEDKLAAAEEAKRLKAEKEAQEAAAKEEKRRQREAAKAAKEEEKRKQREAAKAAKEEEKRKQREAAKAAKEEEKRKQREQEAATQKAQQTDTKTTTRKRTSQSKATTTGQTQHKTASSGTNARRAKKNSNAK